MYKKGIAVELQFSPDRLNDGAGDPYWIDLTRDEAQSLLQTLQTQLSAHTPDDAAPLVITLDPAPQPAPTPPVAAAASTNADTDFKQWVCVICGWVYDEATGYPEDGLAPGTRWADIPADWRCPLCDVGKDEFAMVEF